MYNIGIIGCTDAAWAVHAPAYHAHANCNLCAYYDLELPRAQALCDQYGGMVYDRIETLIEHVDAVSVLQEFKAGLLALNGNVGVLMDIQDLTGEEISRFVKEANGRGMLFPSKELHALCTSARTCLERGVVGELVSFLAPTNATFGAHDPEGILSLLTGREIIQVTGVDRAKERAYCGGCFYVVRLSGGAVGVLRSSVDEEAVLYGTKGTVRVGLAGNGYLHVEQRANGAAVSFEPQSARRDDVIAAFMARVEAQRKTTQDRRIPMRRQNAWGLYKT